MPQNNYWMHLTGFRTGHPITQKNFEDYCKNKQCYQANYKKVATGGNDPSISRRVKYSQTIRGCQYRTVIGVPPSII